MTTAPAVGVCGSTSTQTGAACTQPVNAQSGRCSAGHVPRRLPAAASAGTPAAAPPAQTDPLTSQQHAWLPPGRPEPGDPATCRRCGGGVTVTADGPWAHDDPAADTDHRPQARLCDGCGDMSPAGGGLCENCADRTAAGFPTGLAPYPDDIDRIPFAERAAQSLDPVWANADLLSTHWDADDLIGCDIRVIVIEEDERDYQETEVAGTVTAIAYDTTDGTFTINQPDGSTVDVDMTPANGYRGGASRSVSSRVLIAGEDARRQIADGRAGGYIHMARLAEDGNTVSAF